MGKGDTRASLSGGRTPNEACREEMVKKNSKHQAQCSFSEEAAAIAGVCAWGVGSIKPREGKGRGMTKKKKRAGTWSKSLCVLKSAAWAGRESGLPAKAGVGVQKGKEAWPSESG